MVTNKRHRSRAVDFGNLIDSVLRRSGERGLRMIRAEFDLFGYDAIAVRFTWEIGDNRGGFHRHYETVNSQGVRYLLDREADELADTLVARTCAFRDSGLEKRTPDFPIGSRIPSPFHRD